MLSSLALLVGSAHAHITMNPNYGAETGGYFGTAIKVPHGEHGMHTTSMVLHVPRGVHSAVPVSAMGFQPAHLPRPTP